MISFVTPKAARRAPRGSRRSSSVKGPERLEERMLLANTVGLISQVSDLAYQGYTLFAPSNATTTFLVDMAGNKVRSWQSSLSPMTAELLPDGSLIRAGRVPTQGVSPGQTVTMTIGGNACGSVVGPTVCAACTPCCHRHGRWPAATNGRPSTRSPQRSDPRNRSGRWTRRPSTR